MPDILHAIACVRNSNPESLLPVGQLKRTGSHFFLVCFFRRNFAANQNGGRTGHHDDDTHTDGLIATSKSAVRQNDTEQEGETRRERRG